MSKSIQVAREKLNEALSALTDAQNELGRGAGGREVALAITNAEQARMWLEAASDKVVPSGNPA